MTKYNYNLHLTARLKPSKREFKIELYNLDCILSGAFGEIKVFAQSSRDLFKSFPVGENITLASTSPLGQLSNMVKQN